MSVHSEQLAPVPEPLLRPGKESQLSHNFGIKNRILEIVWYTFPLGKMTIWKNGSKGHFLLFSIYLFFFLEISITFRAVSGSQH